MVISVCIQGVDRIISPSRFIESPYFGRHYLFDATFNQGYVALLQFRMNNRHLAESQSCHEVGPEQPLSAELA